MISYNPFGGDHSLIPRPSSPEGVTNQQENDQCQEWMVARQVEQVQVHVGLLRWKKYDVSFRLYSRIGSGHGAVNFNYLAPCPMRRNNQTRRSPPGGARCGEPSVSDVRVRNLNALQCSNSSVRRIAFIALWGDGALGRIRRIVSASGRVVPGHSRTETPCHNRRPAAAALPRG